MHTKKMLEDFKDRMAVLLLLEEYQHSPCTIFLVVQYFHTMCLCFIRVVLGQQLGFQLLAGFVGNVQHRISPPLKVAFLASLVG